MKQSVRWGATIAAVLLGASACGGAGSHGGTKVSSTKSSGSGLRVATTSLGKVLVDSRGMTVYMLTSDSPGRSNCPSTCLTYWPPVSALPSGTKPAGVTAQVSHTKDTAGKQIATAGGWPLYTYIKDQAPGDVTGQDVKTFGGVWHVLSPAGKPVTGAASSSGSGSGAGGY